MPTLSWSDGSFLTWGDSTTPTAVPSAALTGAPLPTDVASVSPDASPTTSGPTTADVSAALNTAPPRWTATAWRFVKGLLAGFASAFTVAFAASGGTIEGVMRDPWRFVDALAVGLGTGAVLAVDKFRKWKA